MLKACYFTSRRTTRKSVAKLALVASMTLVMTAGIAPLQAQERFDWMPPESVNDTATPTNLGGPLILPEITFTSIPKPTANEANYTNKYVLDLKKFNISNDGTNAVETSKGINAALQHARHIGANRIEFPKGTYLISELDPIIINHKNTIVDLNGATLQINTNGKPDYAIVKIVDGADTVRLTNGTLRGDNDVHDHGTGRGGHASSAALLCEGGKNLEIDHLFLTNIPGDGVYSSTGIGSTRLDLLQRIHHRVFVSQLESGNFSDKGVKIDDPNTIRSIESYDLSRLHEGFTFAHPFDYMGFPAINGRAYQIVFLDKNRKFMEKRDCLQYRTVMPPEGAESMYLIFNQPSAKSVNPEGSVGRIIQFTPSVDVHFHDNDVSGNRRLGFAICGGQRWIIENNKFDRNGGAAPAYGIDFEDGWELMMDFVVRKNTFKDNAAGDLVICAGTELLIEDNVFESNVSTHARPHNYTFRNNTFNGGGVAYQTRTGIASIHDNTYNNVKSISISFDTKAVADGIYRKPGETVSTPPLLLKNEKLNNVGRVTGTYLNFENSNFNNVNFIAGQNTKLVNFKGGSAVNTSVEYQAADDIVYEKSTGVKGKIEASGPGLNRRKALP